MMAPSEFMAKAQARGFVFSLKPDGSLGVKPPTPGAMTNLIRAYVREAKPLLVEALALVEMPPVEAGSAAYAAWCMQELAFFRERHSTRSLDADDLHSLLEEADLEHELLDAHYGKRLPLVVRPAIRCPSGRHIGNPAVAVEGMLQRHRGEQQGVHIGPKLAQADRVDWEFLLEWWCNNEKGKSRCVTINDSKK